MRDAPALACGARAALAALALSALARAEPAPPAPAPPVPAPSTQAPAALPAEIPVSDPLLAPPPDAPRVVRSWDDALRAVRAASPTYLSSLAGVTRAEGQARIALAAVLPMLAANGTYTHQFVTQTLNFGGATFVYPPPDVLTAGATLSWSVLNPRAIYAAGTAREAVDVARLSFAEARRQIALALVTTMLATLAQARVAELNRVGLRAALERLALTEGKLRFGQGTPLDVDRAQQDVAAARAQVISGDESLRQAREALGSTLGLTVPVAAAPDLDVAHLERTVTGACRLSAELEARPDVAAARARLAVAERAIDDAWLQLSPSLAVQSQAQWQSEVSFGPRSVWSLQGVVSVPLYDGGARYGALRDARGAAEQAREQLAQTRLAALLNVTQSARAVSVYQASRDVAKQQRELAARIDARTREGYAHGLGTSLDLVTSAVALRQAEINLALLEFQLAQARADAALATADCAY